MWTDGTDGRQPVARPHGEQFPILFLPVQFGEEISEILNDSLRINGRAETWEGRVETWGCAPDSSATGQRLPSQHPHHPFEEAPCRCTWTSTRWGGVVTAADVATAHMADLQTQNKYDVRYLRYWVDEQKGKVFCLVEAPSAEAAATVHRQAYGLVADDIFQVQEGS